MALFDDASLVVTPNGYKAGTLYSIKPTSGAGDMTVVRATTATRVNSAGLIESVANNVPRLDYLNASCPSLLVEPQRTNVLLYSEQFDNAAYWSPFNATLTGNTMVAPDGTTTADTIISNASTGGDVYRLITLNGTYTLSAYFKSGTTANAGVAYSNGVLATYNLTNQTFVVTGSGTAKIENANNGWYRCSLTTTITAGTLIAYSASGTTGQTINIWGAQLEVGSYPTSYIPTTTASVTRNADAIYKTGISSLIGQTEGTVYWEGQVNGFGQYPQLFDLNANGNKFIQIFNSVVSGIPRIGIYVQNVGVLLIDGNIATISYDTNFKFALGYKANDYVVYLNGNQVYTNTTIGVPPTSNFGLGDAEQGGSTSKKNINSSVLFPTRLTNAELAQLTTL